MWQEPDPEPHTVEMALVPIMESHVSAGSVGLFPSRV